MVNSSRRFIWEIENTDQKKLRIWTLFTLSQISKISLLVQTAYPQIHLPEAATGGALQEKVFLKIVKNSQENTCSRLQIYYRTSLADYFWFASFVKSKLSLEECYIIK